MRVVGGASKRRFFAYLMVFILAPAMAATAINWFVRARVQGNAAYQHAQHVAVTDDRVAGVLGRPVTQGWLSSGSITYESGRPECSMSGDILVRGPRGRGRVRVEASERHGKWVVERLAFEGPTGTIDLRSGP